MGEPEGPGCTRVGCLVIVVSGVVMALAVLGLVHAIGWLL